MSVEQEDCLYKGMVVRVYPVDDNGNLSKGAGNQELLYDLIILGGPRAGHKVNGARDLCFLGGINNYSERVWRAATNPNFKRDGGLDLSQQDGDVVFFCFLGGNPFYPIILGAATHYQNNGKTGATSNQMPRLLFEYNGLHVLIDNQGQLWITRKAGTASTKTAAFTPGTTEECNVQLINNTVIIKDKSGNNITIDAVTKSIFITAPEEFKVSCTNMNLLASNSYTLSTKTATVNASTSHTLNTPVSTVNASTSETLNTATSTVNASGTHNINTPTTNINIGGSEGTINVNGSSYSVVTSNSYDPFLMAKHIDSYNKFKTKG
jgi:hypothetical protein